MKVFFPDLISLDRQKLRLLMIKIADSSKYKSTMLIDDYDEERVRDYDLAIDALVFIFTTSLHQYLPEVFKELSYKQQSNFLEYYDSFFEEKAFNFGLLSESLNLRRKMPSLSYKIFKALGYLCVLIGAAIIYLFAVHSIILTLIILLLLHNSESKYTKSDAIMKQNDLIIEKINNDLIQNTKESSIQNLLKAGWLEEDGEYEQVRNLAPNKSKKNCDEKNSQKSFFPDLDSE